MILAPRFLGDEHIWVMDIQHGVYMQSIARLTDEVCRVFCFACVVTEALPDLLQSLRRVQTQGVDHRILQETHDHVAARYRAVNLAWLQPTLLLDWDQSNEVRVLQDWQTFWTGAVQIICEDALLLRACAECIATSGGKSNAEKEEFLLQLVRQRFPV